MSRQYGWWRTVVVAGLALFPLSPCIAAGAASYTSKHTTATLISSSDTVSAGHSFQVGLHLQLAPGWHTYWRNPGDAGVATEFTIKPVPGVTIGPVQWPVPQRVAEGTLTTYAYQHEVVLPVDIMPGTGLLELQAHASWLVCRDVCVPEDANFVLDLPQGPVGQSAQAPLFAAQAASLPKPALFDATLSSDGVMTLSGQGLPARAQTVDFFPNEDGVVNLAAATRPTLIGDKISAQLRFEQQPNTRSGTPGVILVTGPSGAAEAFEAVAGPGPVATPMQPLASLLVLAVGGGLLLNLMPCVFPILAMKAMALARMSGASRRNIRAEAASYTLGVIVAFTALGGALLALRQAGEAVGWGFQFQSPIFVTGVAWVLFASGLNMSGVFSLGHSLSGTGQSLAGRSGHIGSFFTGLLAVVVATPCTASFMVVAIAGALAEPAPLALLVFFALGAGLAVPYIVIAAAPQLTGMLPRPGRWMEILRQGLAFPMYGAAAWLVWVVSQQSGSGGVLTAAAGFVALGFAGWSLGLGQSGSGAGHRSSQTLAASSVLVAVALLVSGTGEAPGEASEPFSVARLAELRSEGRPVFVNMTAAWCLTCLVNERIALSPPAVRDAFAHAHVAYLKGDWTKQDPAISNYLREQGRDGVPLYVFYAPGQPPAVLPQLLSERTLLDEVKNAGG